MRNWNWSARTILFSSYLIHILPMRNWNDLSGYPSCLLCLFTSYLWGIETILFVFNNSFDWEFTSYLWGIETWLHILSPHPSGAFTSYLWGIETIELIRYIQPVTRIHILPMRNWNCTHKWWAFSLYRFTSYLWGIETSINELPSSYNSIFTSYLWGIETTFQLVGSKNDETFTSYLWGIETSPIQSLWNTGWCIHILPMRNWNCSLLKIHL